MKKNVYGLNVGVCVAVALMTGGCIDHDYDLSEDIDLTVKVGGESFSIPKSSTDVITLSQILSLDEGSSIKAAAQGEYGLNAGDYVLVQSGNPSHSDFRIGEVSINSLTNSRVETPEIPYVYPGPIGGASEISLPVPALVNSISISDDNVTRDLVSLSKVGVDMSVNVELSYTSASFNGMAYIDEGYTITFDDAWTIEVPAGNVYSVVDGHIIKFNQRAPISPNKPFTVSLKVTQIDLTKVPSGEGLYAPGHFKLNATIASEGNLYVNMGNTAAGATGKLKLVIAANVLSAKITSVTGVVNPSININDTRFEINDIPDFLSDSQNSLDVDNPRFYVTVSNNSPVKIELNAKLESFKGSESLATAGVGAANGTAPVIIGANGSTKILISQKPVPAADAVNIIVSNLSDLIKTIPDYMLFKDVQCKVVQEEVVLALAPTYTFDTDYEAIIPLSFGDAMRLHYTHEEKEWDVDDMDKYNFNEVHVSFSAINAIPLSMTPDAKALDRNGNEINDVTVTVEGSIAAGTAGSPSVNPVKLILKSNAANLARLDGVRLIFDATSDPQFVGQNLNEAQSLKFTDITATIIGGVTIDLND